MTPYQQKQETRTTVIKVRRKSLEHLHTAQLRSLNFQHNLKFVHPHYTRAALELAMAS